MSKKSHLRGCLEKFRCNYLRNRNFFLNFLLDFWNLQYILNLLKKKMTSSILYFQNYGLRKRGEITVQKGPFQRILGQANVKQAEALLKFESEHLYPIHWPLPSQLSWKKSLLFICKILGLLPNILAVNENNPVDNKDNLTIPIQMQLSQKQKFFLNFLLHFRILDEILNILGKNMTITDFVFAKLRTPQTWWDKCLKVPFQRILRRATC